MRSASTPAARNRGRLSAGLLVTIPKVTACAAGGPGRTEIGRHGARWYEVSPLPEGALEVTQRGLAVGGRPAVPDIPVGTDDEHRRTVGAVAIGEAAVGVPEQR